MSHTAETPSSPTKRRFWYRSWVSIVLAGLGGIGALGAVIRPIWETIDGGHAPALFAIAGLAVSFVATLLIAFSTHARNRRVEELEAQLEVSQAELRAVHQDKLTQGSLAAVFGMNRDIGDLLNAAGVTPWTQAQAHHYHKSIVSLGTNLLEKSGVPSPRVCLYLPLREEDGPSGSSEAVKALKLAEHDRVAGRKPPQKLLHRSPDTADLFAHLKDGRPIVYPARDLSACGPQDWRCSAVIGIADTISAGEGAPALGIITADSLAADGMKSRNGLSPTIILELLATLSLPGLTKPAIGKVAGSQRSRIVAAPHRAESAEGSTLQVTTRVRALDHTEGGTQVG